MEEVSTLATIHFLGSIFLPSTIFDAVSTHLRARGHDVAVTVPTDVESSQDVLSLYVRALQENPGATVVPHSNAGSFIPQLAQGDLIDSVIFMDAALPDDRGGRTEMFTLEQREQLADLGEGSLLPKWIDWWPPSALQEVFLDENTLNRIRSQTPRVPRGFIHESLDNPDEWQRTINGAYIAFGSQYRKEREMAECLGWTSVTIDTGHLGHLREPARVAAALDFIVCSENRSSTGYVSDS